MNKYHFHSSSLFSLVTAFSLVAVLLAACSPDLAPVPSPTGGGEMNAAMTQAFATVNAAMTGTAQGSAPTETLVPTATATHSGPPPALPPIYQSSALNPLDTPHTYIPDTCQYLKAKWDPNNSAPGTIVIVVMIHGIEKGVQTASKVDNIGGGDFKKMMNNLHKMGFIAINTQQLENFLYTNAKIPQRSVVLIQDDRKTGENFNSWFRPYWQEWGWSVVNAWINQDSYLDPNWTDNIAVEKEGLVDHQAHGVKHMPSMDDNSSDEYIRSELQGSIDGIQQYYGKMPIAIIWPGGGFGVRPVQMARQLGYKLGFTAQPRGPLMFNWIPLADANDAGRPSYYAEGYVNDPLMVLPRYWDTDIAYKLDEIRILSKDAAAYAEQVKAVELEYYDIVCAPTLGPIPALAP
jgi:hypothetical protein